MGKQISWQKRDQYIKSEFRDELILYGLYCCEVHIFTVYHEHAFLLTFLCILTLFDIILSYLKNKIK